MKRRIRLYENSDSGRVLEICIAAFTPIHQSFERALGSGIFRLEFGDWKKQYEDQIAAITLDDPATRVYVVEENDRLTAFIFTIMHEAKKMGEIGLNAVDPSCQRQGIGRLIYDFALDDLRKRGAKYAYVGTGSDDAHAPARSAYKAAGFDKTIPSMHFFRSL